MATAIPARSWASSVDAPRCGVATTLSRANKGESVQGSVAKTSSPAPATRPSFKASNRAFSSSTPPRAALMMRTDGLTFLSASAPMRFAVSFVLGRWIVMKSERFSNSSSETRSTPSWAALAGCRYGSKAITFIPKACIRVETSWPIRPKPTMPNVFSNNSAPVYFERAHLPFLRAAFAGTTNRAEASNKEMASSAALTMLEVGAFTTITPAEVAEGISTLSKPTPARAITFNPLAAEIAS